MKIKLKNKDYFSGVFVPAFVFQKFKNEEINVNEFCFLCYINAKVNPMKDPPLGDFLLDKKAQKEISKTFHVPETWAVKRVTKLVKQGLVKRTTVDGKRYIRTLWSRPDIVEYVEKTRKKKPEKQKKKEAKKKNEKWKDCAEKLNDAVKEETGVDRSQNTGQWANSFRLLNERDKVDEDKIREVLDWYVGEVGNGDKYLPQAYSGNTFRTKFPKLIQAKRRYGDE